MRPLFFERGAAGRRPYTAVKRISKAIVRGDGALIPASEMDALYSTKPAEWRASLEAALNLAVTEMADVLHRFYLNVVAEGE